MESGLEFFLSRGGQEFTSLGKITNNSVAVVNKLQYYKNVLWVATDKGLYHDAGTMLSSHVTFSLQYITGSPESSLVPINDIVTSNKEIKSDDALYVCSYNGSVYQYKDNVWKRFTTNLSTIHKMQLIEDFDIDYIIAIGFNQIETIAVSSFDTNEDVVVIDTQPCLEQ